MAKRLVIKVGEYQKEGETKGEYMKLGVILEHEGNEFVLLDPTVNLAGCLMKQRVMNQGKEKKGKGDMVMCSIFTDEPRQNAQPSGGAAPSGGSSGGSFDDFDTDIIPF